MNNADRKQFLLFFAWIASLAATLGSLYFSEIKGFIPCELCWYQRILMYPLTVMLGIATFQNDTAVKKYVLPLSIVGWFISLFHYLEQKMPGFAKIKPCATGVPCSGEYINWLGFMTIPFLALIAFTIVIGCMILIRKDK